MLYYLVVSLSLNLILIIYIIFKKNRVKYTLDDFQIANHILDEMVKLYYENDYAEKNGKLRKVYDIDPNSKVNAIESYNDAQTKLKRELVKDILLNFSKKTKSILYYYYSEKNLVYKIITKFV